MTTATHSRFELFAREFVRKYWETVKSGAFLMAPNEPIEETVEELLAGISHETELDSSGQTGPLYKLCMLNTDGDGWHFGFRESAGSWVLVGGSASSDDDKKPHDLFGPVYSQHFEPFLHHVTEVANAQRGI